MRHPNDARAAMPMPHAARLALALTLCLGPALVHAAPTGSTAAPDPVQGASAPHLRVAFVDTARILRDSTLAKAASRKLAQDFEPRRRKLTELGQRIELLRNRLQDNTVTMSDDQRMQAQQQLADLNRQFRDDQQAFAEDLNAQRNADVSRILDEANAVVDQVARRMGCSIVFQNAVYVNPRIDITSAVIHALDTQKAAH